MLVFSRAKLVFLSVPKTGTTAYAEALAPQAAMVVRDPPELKHAPVFRYNRFFRPALEKFIGEDLDVVAVMREPVDWLGSWFRYRRRPFMEGRPNSTHGISFDDFVLAYTRGQRPGFANVGSQTKFLEPQRNGTRVTHLFRYEDQAGLRAFLEARLGTRIETHRHNESPRLPLSLSAEVETRLRRKCADEFALWDGIGENGAYRPLSDADG
ncbi:gamma-glutamyl kinase [Roseovarius salinarum]|uniref:gamma-glutamyl kinase n=1 Tax=Roseovarius salinarum TaxID=1981892 RepID=UPI000C336668|nr:gamma-glutamyl kinase [Roseovarius salinarum]